MTIEQVGLTVAVLYVSIGLYGAIWKRVDARRRAARAEAAAPCPIIEVVGAHGIRRGHDFRTCPICRPKRAVRR